MTQMAIVLAALALAIGRLLVEPSSPTIADVYKDAAHLFVGALFVMWKREVWPDTAALYKWIFIGLCVWEVAVAIVSRIF